MFGLMQRNKLHCQAAPLTPFTSEGPAKSPRQRGLQGLVADFTRRVANSR